ncbi:hypothetical protein JCM8097_005148 [Rhodosporidiobolus ruineniae]
MPAHRPSRQSPRVLDRSPKHVSCEGCRTRKMRCSRTANCKGCQARGVACVWKSAIPSRTSEEVTLDDQEREIQRLNRLVVQLAQRVLELGGKTSDIHGAEYFAVEPVPHAGPSSGEPVYPDSPTSQTSSPPAFAFSVADSIPVVASSSYTHQPEPDFSSLIEPEFSDGESSIVVKPASRSSSSAPFAFVPPRPGPSSSSYTYKSPPPKRYELPPTSKHFTAARPATTSAAVDSASYSTFPPSSSLSSRRPTTSIPSPPRPRIDTAVATYDSPPYGHISPAAVEHYRPPAPQTAPLPSYRSQNSRLSHYPYPLIPSHDLFEHRRDGHGVA